MSLSDWTFHSAPSATFANGDRILHTAISPQLSSDIGGTYARNFYNNNRPVKFLLSNPNYQGFDGTQAVSLRARLYIDQITAYSHFFFLFKANNGTLDDGLANWRNSVGYKVGPINNTTLTSSPPFYTNSYHLNNGTTQSSTSGANTFGGGTVRFNPDDWYHIRMDLLPDWDNPEDKNVVSDTVVLYNSEDNGQTWQELKRVTFLASANGYIPWADSTRKYYGFQTHQLYVDNFEIYTSTGYF